MYTTFLLFFFQIFKVYSRYSKSPLLQQLASISLLKKKSKICPKLSAILFFFQNVFKVIQTLVFNQGTKSNVNNPDGLVGLPPVMRSAHFFVTHTQTEKISSWNGLTVHVCCFMLAHASTKTFVSRIHIRQPSPKNSEKKSSLAEKFVSRVTRQLRYHCTPISANHFHIQLCSDCSMEMATAAQVTIQVIG